MTKYMPVAIAEKKTFCVNTPYTSLDHAEASMYKGFEAREVLL